MYCSMLLVNLSAVVSNQNDSSGKSNQRQRIFTEPTRITSRFDSIAFFLISSLSLSFTSHMSKYVSNPRARIFSSRIFACSTRLQNTIHFRHRANLSTTRTIKSFLCSAPYRSASISWNSIHTVSKSVRIFQYSGVRFFLMNSVFTQ